MPVKVVKNLPAIEELRRDNIFVMDSERAMTQQIRPLSIVVVNLMPRKLVTETQILRLLSNTPLQITVDFIYMTTHEAHNVAQNHLDSFYKAFLEVKDRFYDGMIVTGAPVENMAFEAVDYWQELEEILDWSKTHVFSTLHICWGAQAGLYSRYGIGKVDLPKKLVGVYRHQVIADKHPLMRGFDDVFDCPHSRYTASDLTRLPADFELLARSEIAGEAILAKKNLREIYVFGHLEYDRETLAWEYARDKKAGLAPDVPEDYFPQDDDKERPAMTWASSSHLFFANWLNYAVYQETPFDAARLAQHADEEYDFNSEEESGQ
ncbi:MAG: homoserine O-succinyltransferase [Streptococcaceae bacterium]|jgi:homoserine O-succinyltransferase|nr:homoserine O-succinyltransferase [Streptococcaceae bacterium]